MARAHGTYKLGELQDDCVAKAVEEHVKSLDCGQGTYYVDIDFNDVQDEPDECRYVPLVVQGRFEVDVPDEDYEPSYGCADGPPTVSIELQFKATLFSLKWKLVDGRDDVVPVGEYEVEVE